MRDELFDRDYQQARAGLNDGMDRLFARLGRFIMAVSEAQVRIEWDAPWHRPARSQRNGIA